MTIAELRKNYPHSEFYFFKDGLEMRKAPFYHSEIKGFEEVNSYTVFVHM
jgi:hypothetical protein